jgi:toxin ParE1/3/4
VKSISISREAESDIDQVAAYTTNAWGARQTDRYLDQLENAFQIFEEHPLIGRSCESIAAGLLRFEVGKHVVFYRTEPGRIRVVRVLHQKMMPTESRFDPALPSE